MCFTLMAYDMNSRIDMKKNRKIILYSGASEYAVNDFKLSEDIEKRSPMKVELPEGSMISATHTGVLTVDTNGPRLIRQAYCFR